eukprot:TRINITY_DN320_c0_g1_i2.p1 TRINITY_DN320_c0_g1~~TRINITY_DN320_c0_g1_i2.p1  ORF type:complete len:488 (-),score=130.48 TRINITY_DN320_c0_g1_i2:54-1517(-)
MNFKLQQVVRVVIPQLHTIKTAFYTPTLRVHEFIDSLLDKYFVCPSEKFGLFMPLYLCKDNKLAGVWLDLFRTVESYGLNSVFPSVLLVCDESVCQTKLVACAHVLLNWILSNSTSSDKLNVRWITAWTEWASAIPPTPNFSALRVMVREGVPAHLRGLLWSTVLGLDVKVAENPGVYERFKLCANCVFDRKIKADLNRSFPTHPFFQSPQHGQLALLHVLHAYACACPEVGYCQGMNFVAGVLLLQLSEEHAFWALDLLVRTKLHGFFLPNVPGLLVVLQQFEDLMCKQLSSVHEQFVAEGVPYQVRFPEWFQTLFSGSFPMSTVLRIWDLWLAEDDPAFPLRVAFAFLKMNRDRLVKMDSAGLMQFLATEPAKLEVPQDVDKLIATAYKLRVNTVAVTTDQASSQPQPQPQQQPQVIAGATPGTPAPRPSVCPASRASPPSSPPPAPQQQPSPHTKVSPTISSTPPPPPPQDTPVQACSSPRATT